MTRPTWCCALALFSALACSAACGSKGSPSATSVTPDAGPAAADCPPCTSDVQCGAGSVCAQIGAGTVCAPACPNGNECASDRACNTTLTAAGTQSDLCVPLSDVCGAAPSDGGMPGVDAAVPYDAGAAGTPTGTVTANGGTLSRLLFAVAGDTRPNTEGDVAGYPTSIITKIFTDIEGQAAHPPFVVATGDYMYAAPGATSSANQQLALYLGARSKYSGLVFPVMGNHECTGGDVSNCGTGNTNGVTTNYTAFMTKLLAPIQKTLPYYTFTITATDSSWTAKFVLIAANAWDSTQASWLDSTLAMPSTYTFVFRHESATSSPMAPGVAPSEAIMAKHPYTLSIVGHTHSYFHGKNAREATIGNGGAPLSSKNYGFGVFSQRADGAIVGDMIDYQSGLADNLFHMVVKPDGTFTK
jgi:hypothetical protein